MDQIKGKKCESWHILQASKYGFTLNCGKGIEINTISKEFVLISKELCYYIDNLLNIVEKMSFYDYLLFKPITYFYDSIKIVPINPAMTGEKRAIYEEKMRNVIEMKRCHYICLCYFFNIRFDFEDVTKQSHIYNGREYIENPDYTGPIVIDEHGNKNFTQEFDELMEDYIYTNEKFIFIIFRYIKMIKARYCNTVFSEIIIQRFAKYVRHPIFVGFPLSIRISKNEHNNVIFSFYETNLIFNNEMDRIMIEHCENLKKYYNFGKIFDILSLMRSETYTVYNAPTRDFYQKLITEEMDIESLNEGFFKVKNHETDFAKKSIYWFVINSLFAPSVGKFMPLEINFEILNKNLSKFNFIKMRELNDIDIKIGYREFHCMTDPDLNFYTTKQLNIIKEKVPVLYYSTIDTFTGSLRALFISICVCTSILADSVGILADGVYDEETVNTDV